MNRNKKMQYYALLVALVFLMIGAVIAAPQPTQPTQDKSVATENAPAVEDPVKMLRGITSNVLHALETRKNHDDLDGIYAMVDNFVLPYVDFDEMSQWVAGRTVWSKADAATRKQFIEAFKILVVRTYATALNNYTNEKIEFSKQKLNLQKERIQVNSVIVRQSGKKENIRLDYRLIKKDNKWYVYDVIIEGVSILQGFQAQFSNEIRQKGLQKVTAQIQEHNREKHGV